MVANNYDQREHAEVVERENGRVDRVGRNSIESKVERLKEAHSGGKNNLERRNESEEGMGMDR